MPAISIIVPIYNVEKYLRRCLDSVLNQTFSDWEAICVNDGSPDNSDKILAEYASRDKRFKIVNKTNGGLSDARNAGFPHATGKYIMYLDSDDFIHPQTMEIAYKMAVRDNSDMVSFSYDRNYRARLKIRSALHMGVDNVVPRGLRKKYKITRIRTLVTDDVYKYAIEKNPKAVSLIKDNCNLFGIQNVSVIEKDALSVMDELVTPTHAFIGGSGGSMKDILKKLYEKNHHMSVVINAVSTETMQLCLEIEKEFKTMDFSMVQVGVTRLN